MLCILNVDGRAADGDETVEAVVLAANRGCVATKRGRERIPIVCKSDSRTKSSIFHSPFARGQTHKGEWGAVHPDVGREVFYDDTEEVKYVGHALRLLHRLAALDRARVALRCSFRRGWRRGGSHLRRLGFLVDGWFRGRWGWRRRVWALGRRRVLVRIVVRRRGRSTVRTFVWLRRRATGGTVVRWCRFPTVVGHGSGHSEGGEKRDEEKELEH